MTNPPRNHKVTLAEAQALLAKRPTGITERGGHFPRQAIEAILAQPGCVGLRFYYGTNPDGTPTLVLVGIDANEADMTAGVMIDNHFPCPPFCDDKSALR